MKKLLLLCISLLMTIFSLQAQVSCLEHDSLELVKIYNDCGGTNWTTTWDLNGPVSTWYGVTLTGDGCGVEEINLAINNLIGAFPSIDLSNLTTLNLYNNELTTIPDISNLTNLTYLNLSNNELTTIPDISNLTNLTSLLFYNNELTILPGISNLTNLTYLGLGSNELTTIPDISNLTDLRTLGLSDNELTTIPDISNLTNLTSLYLNGNQLMTISDISNLTNLKTLSLYDNLLMTIPDISNLTNLTYLNLDANLLTTIPDISNLTNLIYLKLDANLLTTIPDISSLTNLTYLYLGSNQLTTPPDISNLTNLTYLNLYNNQLTTISDISSLTNLTSLYLGSNQLTTTPDISNLTSLTSLNLGNNQLTTTPNISNLTSLTSLNLGNNQLTTTPDISNLTSLTYLHLGYNQFTAIPDISNLTNLTEFHLDSNQFTTIPDISNLTNLTYLNLFGNQLNFSELLPSLGTSTYYYSPQDTLPLLVLSLNKLTFPTGGNLADNQYTWYKNGLQIATITGDSTLNIEESGTYSCNTTNSQLPNLTLWSKEMYVGYTCPSLIQDSLQLLKIYTATNGLNWDTLWNLSEPISTWHGISLTADGCHVESIDFGFFGNGLTGTFPALNLGELKTLKLIRNEITAVESLEGLPSLEFLELSNNELTELPSLEDLQNLENLYLANNQLASVPDYSSLTKLKRLSLFNNQLEQVPDYSGLALLERLYLYNNRLSSLPAYDGLAALAFLSIDGNRLDFSDISPSTTIPNFSYAPQDSLALSLDQGELIFNVGGNLADNTYTWFVDSIAQAPIVGNNSFPISGAGKYRCEVANSQLPDLILYSYEVNFCGSFTASEYLLPETSGVLCTGEPVTLNVFDFLDPSAPPDYSRYVFTVNGIVMQDAASTSFVSSLKDGDLVSCIVYDNNCSYFTNEYIANFHDEIDLLICQDNPNQFNAKLRQGTPPWNFNLVEYSNGLAITSTPYTVQGADINISCNPDSYYEITEVADANCSSNNIFSSPKINGCAALCVGYSDPQVEYYTADFSKPVSPGNLTWTISPAAALSAGDVEIISGNNDFVLQLNFPNAAPGYTEITLTATAQTDCSTEILEKQILLDTACVWPGDINDDGEIRAETPGIPWIDDAIALSSAISVQRSIGNSQNNETLLPYPRPPSCLAENTYDWVPQSARDWQFDSSDTIRPVYFSLFNENNSNLDFFNLKYADADGNGYLDDTPHFNSFEDDFDTLSVISDIDVVAYHEHLNHRHNGNATSYKANNLSELIQITVPDTVFASGDEVVFRATLGDADNVLDSVVQVAFRAEGAFGTYQRPEVRLAASHLSINFNDLVDYPFLLPNAEGVAADSLEWLLSLHSPNFIAKQFDGDELCSIGCHVVIAGFADENQQAKNFTNPLGVPSTFKITAGVKLANGRIIYARSNEVTIYIKPDPYLSARVFLEGAYEDSTGLMRDDLRLGRLIPATEPYSAQTGYPFPKGELREIGMTDGMAVLSVTGQEAIVDWVLVEVWEDSSRICSRPALLTRSGQVVDTDGSSAVPMNRVPYGDYHIVIRHRNHLPVMSSSPINLQRGVATLDFTNQNTAGQAEIAPGVYGLYAGDATLELGYTIHGQDKAYWSTKNGYSRIYEQADFDMDTDVNGVDKVIWKRNNGVFVEVIFSP